MSVATANTAGHTKKVRTNATLLVGMFVPSIVDRAALTISGYCLGNFIGPFFFLTSQAPRYELGVGMMLFCIGVQVLSICGIWMLLWMRNKRRGEALRDAVTGFDLGLMDVTDGKNPHFKVSDITCQHLRRPYTNSTWIVCLLGSLTARNWDVRTCENLGIIVLDCT